MRALATTLYRSLPHSFAGPLALSQISRQHRRPSCSLRLALCAAFDPPSPNSLLVTPSHSACACVNTRYAHCHVPNLLPRFLMFFITRVDQAVARFAYIHTLSGAYRTVSLSICMSKGSSHAHTNASALKRDPFRLVGIAPPAAALSLDSRIAFAGADPHPPHDTQHGGEVRHGSRGVRRESGVRRMLDSQCDVVQPAILRCATVDMT